METLDRLDVPKLRLERIKPEEKNVTCDNVVVEW
jgi:hypothetical protein